jgi:hypothetical protein
MWQIPQMFDWDWFCKADNPKFPTYDEFRNMSYQCVAEGANGLIYFHFSRLLKDDKKFSEHWPYVCKAVREIAASIPVFVLEPGPEVVSCPRERMSVRTWRDGDSVWMLAVNVTRSHNKAEVSLSTPVSSVCETLFGKSPTVSGTALSFDLSPLESVLCRLEVAR